MTSIRQNVSGQRLPDFRNAGVILRSLLGVNLLALVAALVQSQGLSDCIQRYAELALWVQPLLLSNLCFLALFENRLRRMPVWLGKAMVVVLAFVSALSLFQLWSFVSFAQGGWQQPLRAGLLAGLAAASMLSYFALRVSALSPALVEARLQSLTARIRPHFLFNSLNAVVSLIRSDPGRAESALVELAELFRAQVLDHRKLIPLSDEIALCRQYLDLEKLRLGERLHVEWQEDGLPISTEVPPLMLQPLLENAIYHGIEPCAERGTIHIRLLRRADELHVHLSNPCSGGGEHQRGSHMAIDNIRERLALYYDLEARLDTGEIMLADGRHEYRVHIVLPCPGESP